MSNELQAQLALLKEQYLAALPEKIHSINSLWAEFKQSNNLEKLEELYRMAHSFAGSGATFDQVQVSEYSKTLENYIKEHMVKESICSAEFINGVDKRLQLLSEHVINPQKRERHQEKLSVEAIAIDSSEATLATLSTMNVDPMRILLADDDPSVRNILKLFLLSRGHEIFTVNDGEEAVKVFDEVKPDLVLMDVIMPGMAGYEATKILKEKSGSKFVPIIFLTSNSDYETLVRCIAGGGDDFLTKPVNPIILNAKLQAFQRIRVMYEKLDEYQKKTEEELETSKHVFNSLVNNGNDNISGLSCWASSPGHFSGDTRLFKILDNGHVYILLCDFTGHGLPAAIGTVFAADLFRSMTQKSFDAQVILNEINAKMNQILPTGRYCAAILVDYDLTASHLTLWNAGLPTAYLLDRDYNITQEFPSSGVPLGVIAGDVMCQAIEVSVSQGASIMIYSDGVTEAENPQGEMYTEKRLLDVIARTDGEENLFSEIKHEVETFMQGLEPKDDISLIVFSFNHL